MISDNFTQKIDLIEIDSKFKVEINKTSEISSGNRYASIMDFILLKNGDLSVLYEEYELDGKKPIFKGYSLFNIISGGSQNNLTLKVYDKYISSVKFASIDGIKTICAGFYSDNPTNGNNKHITASNIANLTPARIPSKGIQGSFYLNVDIKASKILETNMKAFDKDFITQGWTTWEKKRADKKEENKGVAPSTMYDYDLKYLLTNPDGGITLIAEQYYIIRSIVEKTDSHGDRYRETKYEYNFDDIIIVSYDKNGNIKSNNKIVKNQYSVDDGARHSSFSVMQKGENVYIIYNDKAKHLFEKDDPRLKNKNSMLTIMCTFSQDGKINKEILLNNDKEKGAIIPKLCKQINQDEFLIFLKAPKAQKFGRLTIK